MVVQAEEDSIFTEAEYDQLKKQLHFVYENASDLGLQKVRWYQYTISYNFRIIICVGQLLLCA